MDFGSLLDSLQIVEENIYLKRLIVIAVYLILVKVVDLVIDKIVRRAASLTKITFDDDLINFAHKPTSSLRSIKKLLNFHLKDLREYLAYETDEIGSIIRLQ